MTDTMPSQNIDLSSWNTLYSRQNKDKRNRMEGIQRNPDDAFCEAGKRDTDVTFNGRRNREA
jgi:hypothetical protein